MFLLRAFSYIASQEKDAVLVMVGSGPEEKTVRLLAEDLGLKERVILTGRIPPELISGVYRSADIFVFPSVTETQGLVLVEAMAAGMPVVAKAAFGSLAMVRDGITGYLCRGDEEEFAEKTLALLKDPDLRKSMSLAAAKRAEELSADKMALRLESAYYGLINRKGQ